MLGTLSLTCCGLWELVLQPILATYHWSSLVIARKGDVILPEKSLAVSPPKNTCDSHGLQLQCCTPLHLLREAIAIHIEDAVQTVGAVELLTGFKQNQCTHRSQAIVFEILGCPPQTLKIELSRSSVLCLWLRPQGSKNHSHAIVAAILAMPKLTCPRKLQYTQNSTTHQDAVPKEEVASDFVGSHLRWLILGNRVQRGLLCLTQLDVAPVAKQDVQLI